jgi:hypothetical protein
MRTTRMMAVAEHEQALSVAPDRYDGVVDTFV